MFKAISFNEAYDLMVIYDFAFTKLTDSFGDSLEIVHDALNHYAQTPALWGCDEDGDQAAIMALVLTRLGYNTLKPDYDVTLKFMKASSDAETAS